MPLRTHRKQAQCWEVTEEERLGVHPSHLHSKYGLHNSFIAAVTVVLKAVSSVTVNTKSLKDECRQGNHPLSSKRQSENLRINEEYSKFYTLKSFLLEPTFHQG